MAKTAKDRLIFALDVPGEAEAKRYIDILSGRVGMFKVGLELFIQTGPAIIHYIKDAGNADVFLDLKLHDIPTTVHRAMARIAELGAAVATVHCGENPEMLEAAVTGADGNVGVFGVTVLTSVSGRHLQNAGFLPAYSEDPGVLALKRALIAKEAGCDGVICSGQEVRRIKEATGRFFQAITPGIRPAYGATKDDQRRIVTPAMAVAAGADYLVVGRPIRDADDPGEAADRLAKEIGTSLKQKGA
jgi:orotidine-5'-phosphate decarboxylase